MTDIDLARDGAVATITLNRPDDLNRLTPESMAVLGNIAE